jgi:tRNA(Ile)-lysidine synthase
MAMITNTELALQLEAIGATKVVLALSGGLDSMALLELLFQAKQQYSFQLLAVYVNHGLSAQAQAWGEHCAKACAKREIAFSSLTIVLEHTTNIEAAARDARYQALAPFIDSASSVLLTGHHADDQLETLLLALKRGAGAAGLSGMARQRPFANGHLLRPLLHCSRQAILAFAQQHKLHWVEDESNQDNRFDRNFIRNCITPLLTARWPALSATTGRSMQHLAQQQQLVDHYTEQAMAHCARGQQLDLQALQQQLPLQQDEVLRRWLAQFQLNPSSQWLQTLKTEVIAARHDAMPLLVLADYQLRRYNHTLYLERPTALPAISCRIEWLMQSALVLPVGLGQLQIQTTPGENSLPLLAATTTTVLFGQLSLAFKPALQSQHKPLKQWFKLWQVPPWQRGRVPLLLQGNKLVAVAGYASAINTIQADCWLDWWQN